MSKTHESLRRTQLVRDRIQWTLAGGANTLRGIHATLTGTGLAVPEQTVKQQLEVLRRKGLITRNWGDDQRYYYMIVPLKFARDGSK